MLKTPLPLRISILKIGAALLLAALISVAASEPDYSGRMNAATYAAPSSMPTQTIASQLNSVSCVTSSWCIAVGSRTPAPGNEAIVPLIEVWNGRSWKLMRSVAANRYLNQLQAVSCNSRVFCVAVGMSGVNGGPLIEIWNGRVWSLAASHESNVESSLDGISCYAKHACVAVGSAGSESQERALVESFEGRSWTPQTLASAGRGSSLLSVSCRSAVSCVAVGEAGLRGVGPSNLQTLVVRGKSGSWSREQSPSPGVASQLTGVACASPDRCVAVGSSSSTLSTTSPSKSLILSQTNLGWQAQQARIPGTDQNEPNSISCLSGSYCVVVGAETSSANVNEALAEIMEAKKPIRSVLRNRKGGDLFSSVACVSERWCMVVGLHRPLTGTVPLAELFVDTTIWQAVATPIG
jgi:hypothetical protein